MDRNTLLQTSRTKFLSFFCESIEAIVHQSIERLYEKADKSLSSQIQRTTLDARTFVVRNEKLLVAMIINKIETLLDRSFQTAYDEFRPSFFNAASSIPMALMDLNSFEDDLRVDIMTSRFRTEAGDQLNDLNIRVAILFEQTTIAERENPFRPYLLTRAIMLGVEAAHPEPELVLILTDQISEEFLPRVVKLYSEVNAYLADMGVSAQLKYKPKRAAAKSTNPKSTSGENRDDNEEEGAAQSGHAHSTFSQQEQQHFYPDTHSPYFNKPKAVAKIEQLLKKILSKSQPELQQTPQMEGNYSVGEGVQNKGGGHGLYRQDAGRGNGYGEAHPHYQNSPNTVSNGFAPSNPPPYAPHNGSAGFGSSPTYQSPSMHQSNGSGSSSTPESDLMGGLVDQAQSAIGQWWDGVGGMGQTLRRVFLGKSQSVSSDSTGGAQDVTHADLPHSEITPQLKSALGARAPTSDEIIGQDGEVRNFIIESRDALVALTADQHEKMTIDIVAMLFEFILRDNQVPAEVRAQLGRLQFSVLKMALMDSELLTQKNHPARLLVNRIGSISLALHQVDPTAERISAQICLIVEELLSTDAEDTDLFKKMLDKLDSFITNELLVSDTHIETVVNVVVHAEQRTVRFELERRKLNTLLEGVACNPFLRQFILDTWVQVIEHLEREPDENSARFRLFIPNLLWSVLPKATHEDRCSLLQIIPKLIAVLKEGLQLIGWQPQQKQEILNWLVQAHTAVMRPVEGESGLISLEEMQAHFYDFIHPNGEVSTEQSQPIKEINVQRFYIDEGFKELDSDITGLDGLDKFVFIEDPHQDTEDTTSLDTLGVMELPSIQTHSRELVFPYSDKSDGSVMVEEACEVEYTPPVHKVEVDILDRLRSGVMIELNLSGTPATGRLNWVSPSSSTLILTVNGQETPSIISVRMFRRMLKTSRARFIEVAPLFERAVQSLLESADMIDLELK